MSPPWERSVWVFTFWVVVGVALELWVIRHEWRDDMEAWALAYFGVLRPPGRPSRTKLRIEIASVLLITAGVAGELVVGIRIAALNGQIRGKSAELRNKNAELRSASDLLLSLTRVEASSANERAGSANQKAEKAALARAEIEAKVAWRRLSDEQQTQLANELGSFPPNSEGASFWYNQGDVEAATFATDIAECLQKILVVVQPPADISMLHETGKFGSPIKKLQFGVTVLPTKDDPSRRLADRLIEELNKRGFDAERWKEQPFKDAKLPQIEIFVYPRPQGPQGEYKLQSEREASAKSKANRK